MSTDFRALCAELLWALENAISIIYREDGTKHISTAEPIVNRARAALAGEPAVPEGREPAAVTGRPSDEELLDLLPQGNESGFWLPKSLPSDWVDGEFIAPPKAIIAFARDVLELWGNPAPPPADGEVAELVEWLREQLHVCLQAPWTPGIKHFGRAAELLERLSPPQPVPVGVRPWEREEWCDTDGLCWLGSQALDGSTPTWLYGTPAWAERFPNVHRVLLPAHALPLPEVDE